MTEFTQPTPQAATPDRTPSRLSGGRRAIASVLLTVGLFAVGGTAMALAADPSASPAPSTPAEPSDGGTGTPSDNGTTSPPDGGTGTPSGRPNHADGRDCPDMGVGTGGTDNSQAAPGTPATPESSATPSV